MFYVINAFSHRTSYKQIKQRIYQILLPGWYIFHTKSNVKVIQILQIVINNFTTAYVVALFEYVGINTEQF